MFKVKRKSIQEVDTKIGSVHYYCCYPYIVTCDLHFHRGIKDDLNFFYIGLKVFISHKFVSSSRRRRRNRERLWLIKLRQLRRRLFRNLNQ